MVRRGRAHYSLQIWAKLIRIMVMELVRIMGIWRRCEKWSGSGNKRFRWV